MRLIPYNAYTHVLMTDYSMLASTLVMLDKSASGECLLVARCAVDCGLWTTALWLWLIESRWQCRVFFSYSTALVHSPHAQHILPLLLVTNPSTPAQDFYLIFDTGSADLWVAGSDCVSSSCQGTYTFDSSASSSFSSTGSDFYIKYGSGAAAGVDSQDVVSVAGFSVSDQVFAVVNQTTADILSYPLSGIMGLGFEGLTNTNSKPWWEGVMDSGSLANQTMGVYMARYRHDATAKSVEQNGGEFTIGAVNTSLFTGDINYISIPDSNRDYWRITTEAITLNGSALDSLANRAAAIDTGTTLIGVSTADATAFYSQIPGSEAMTQAQYEGYWQYPCSTTLNVSLQYGGKLYAITNGDFNLGPFTSDSSMCTGSIFEMNLGAGSPVSWIVGASFLKNVYSVFRNEPTAIGFAQLVDNPGSVTDGTSTSSTSNGGSGGTSSSSDARTSIRASITTVGLATVGAIAASYL